jgi:hypothetical protein
VELIVQPDAGGQLGAGSVSQGKPSAATSANARPLTVYGGAEA